SEFSPDQEEKSQTHDNLDNESLIATAGHSPLNQKVLKESHLTGENLTPSFSSPIPSNDDSGEADGIGHSSISSPSASPIPKKKKKLLNAQEEHSNFHSSSRSLLTRRNYIFESIRESRSPIRLHSLCISSMESNLWSVLRTTDLAHSSTSLTPPGRDSSMGSCRTARSNSPLRGVWDWLSELS
ncbi:hypothetical protein PMAYCL1PPCAC_27190, partial [Pristionchus mayeri]